MGQVKWKDGFVNLVLTGYICSKSAERNMRLCKLLAEQGLGEIAATQTLLRSTKDRQLW